MRIITGKDVVCYDSFDLVDEDERKALASDVWNILEDKKEVLYPSQMDANYMSYLFNKANRSIVYLQGYKLEHIARTDEYLRKPIKQALTVSTLKRMYYGTMKWASALGWSFENPLMGSLRTIDDFNTRPYVETGSYMDKEGKTHKCIARDSFTTTGYAGAEDYPIC